MRRSRTGPDGARTSAGSSADLTMSIKTLTSLFTGRYSATMLAAWGLIEGSRRAIAAADAVFATRHAPHCPDHF